jgi:anti-sigma B factor antagonist
VTAPNEFDVSAETAGEGALVVRVSGDLDLATSPRFTEALAAAPAARHLVIDLTDCTFLDSSGVRALVQAVREIPAAGERHVDVVAWSPAILRVLEITGVDRMVPVHRTAEDAL